MNIEIYNDWYVRTDGRIGPWTITTTQQATAEQIHNAYKIYSALLNDGWTLNAISATIGNMQHESSLDPALIEQTNRWRLPNNASTLADVPNSVMQNHYKEYVHPLHRYIQYRLCFRLFSVHWGLRMWLHRNNISDFLCTSTWWLLARIPHHLL